MQAKDDTTFDTRPPKRGPGLNRYNDAPKGTPTSRPWPIAARPKMPRHEWRAATRLFRKGRWVVTLGYAMRRFVRDIDCYVGADRLATLVRLSEEMGLYKELSR